MAISAVSQHGPNPQGGLRRRDRSVSLPVPDARETAAEMMGGLGNLVHEMAGVQEPDWWERVFGPDTPVSGVEPIRPDPGLLPGTGGAPSFLPEGLDWDETEDFQEKVESAGGDLDDPSTWPEWALEQGSKPADEVDPTVWENLLVAPPLVQSMLTAMAGEPGRIGRAHPERQPPPYEPAPPLTEEERKRGKEAIEKIRRDNPNIVNPESTMVPEESMLASIWGAVMDAVPDVDPKTAIMVAAAIAAAVAAGTGVGGPLAPVILGGGAALASQ